MCPQVHECASVLKQFLANLPQPILTEAYFRAHCQVHLCIKRKEVMIDFESILPGIFSDVESMKYFVLGASSCEGEHDR